MGGAATEPLKETSMRPRLLRILPALALATAAIGSERADASQLARTAHIDGTAVQYKVVLPDHYDPEKAYPAILVFGGGPQTTSTIEGTLDRNFRPEAEKRGYIVVAPSAPNGDQFFEGGERIFPQFLDMILADYNPQYFLSVTAFPGYMWRATEAKLRAISNLCVFMYVGETDQYRWHSEMKREAEFLSAIGTVARYTVEQGQPHRMETLAGSHAGRLFDGFEAAEKGCKQ
jgi:hypothetical protein